ncbi:rcc01693 family protein [Aureimonas pseudogalii]|uniref:Putative phage protein (TIGR02216 family) n=1 Tax=Aureimonas pseudogalii TaxID=1744844 RepID=A0A7W6EE74_9HYPH|nr:rcc01693 family protein [Aureimonas pseudogalii]MBB3996568.1 putative phage protein (TIGR02216 family) [Aureimonas pseudogalii]
MSAAAPGEPGGAAAFPWDEAMSVGIGLLRLSPRDFWRMTPRELAGAVKPLVARTAGAPSRGGLTDLMRRFPDGGER